MRSSSSGGCVTGGGVGCEIPRYTSGIDQTIKITRDGGLGAVAWGGAETLKTECIILLSEGRRGKVVILTLRRGPRRGAGSTGRDSEKSGCPVASGLHANIEGLQLFDSACAHIRVGCRLLPRALRKGIAEDMYIGC